MKSSIVFCTGDCFLFRKLQQLLAGKTTRPKKMKSKAGKEFSAKLKLLHDGKVDFVFDKKK